ncbi:MAG TPA: porin [Candidatus Aquilonibacter sp.]|nr:porin [Candidatus Aquilonibacter sp.]
MKRNRLLITIIAGLPLAVNSAVADESATNNETDIETLKQEIQDLDQKVRVLERLRENDKDDATVAAKQQPLVKLDSSGFTFSSPDTNFVIGLHGLIQFDDRSFFETPPGFKAGSDGFLLRKARPILTGTVFHNFDFNFTPDFGGSAPAIYDAYINYHYNPALQVEVGKFKSPVGLELLQSDSWTFFNERTLANNLVPNRDLGAELHGDLFGGVASYAAGLFDGAPDYSNPGSGIVNADYDNNLAFAGRLFFQPFKTSGIDPLQGLGVGVGGSYEIDSGSTTANYGGLTAGYVTDGQQKFFTYSATAYANGDHWRISPQGYYYYGPLGLLGEYVISDQQVTSGASSADLRNAGWEISGGWVLTGESDSYNGVTPKHPFDPLKGQWGAWQVVGRFAELDVDHQADSTTFAAAGSALRARGWSAGVNWYLNKNIRVNASYSHTQFGDIVGTANAVTKQPENVFFTRVQLAF